MRAGGNRRQTLVVAALPVVVLAFVVLACTDDPVPDSDPEAPEAEAFGTEPDVVGLLEPDRGSPPSSLRIVDLVDGDGAEARRGSLVTVHYAGALWEDGVEFDSTWDVHQPYAFEVGAGRVIEGWERGITGEGSEHGPMQEGGRRLLTIPPEQAYGDRGAGDLIGPGETLVFVVDLLEVAGEGQETS